MRHPPLPRSTTPCADQPRSLPDLRRIVSSPKPTSPHSTEFKSEEGTPTFGYAGLSSATPRAGGGDRDTSRGKVNPQATGQSRVNPITASEGMAADPALLAHIQQVGQFTCRRETAPLPAMQQID